jgi:hypothetical protein
MCIFDPQLVARLAILTWHTERQVTKAKRIWKSFFSTTLWLGEQTACHALALLKMLRERPDPPSNCHHRACAVLRAVCREIATRRPVWLARKREILSEKPFTSGTASRREHRAHVARRISGPERERNDFVINSLQIMSFACFGVMPPWPAILCAIGYGCCYIKQRLIKVCLEFLWHSCGEISFCFN